MKRTEWASWIAIVASLVAAAVFAVLTVLETQDKVMSAASTWRADPYHAVLCVTELTVLTGTAAVRLVWAGRPSTGRGDHDRLGTADTARPGGDHAWPRPRDDSSGQR